MEPQAIDREADESRLSFMLKNFDKPTVPAFAQSSTLNMVRLSPRHAQAEEHARIRRTLINAYDTFMKDISEEKKVMAAGFDKE